MEKETNQTENKLQLQLQLQPVLANAAKISATARENRSAYTFFLAISMGSARNTL